jgi:hypothetical protein
MFKLRDRENMRRKKEKCLLAEIRSSVGWSLFFLNVFLFFGSGD